MKLIVGLGNPGGKYEHTRHNVGFDAIDECAKIMDIDLNESKFKGVYGKGNYKGETVFLLKPLTFMNLSGESVRPLMDYFKINIEDVVVIYDDLDLPVGKIRLRQKGGHGGHNGMRSLISHLGTDKFNRIRIGIDRPEPGESVANYVLNTFRSEERPPILEAIEQAARASCAFAEQDFLIVMNEFNK